MIAFGVEKLSSPSVQPARNVTSVKSAHFRRRDLNLRQSRYPPFSLAFCLHPRELAAARTRQLRGSCSHTAWDQAPGQLLMACVTLASYRPCRHPGSSVCIGTWGRHPRSVQRADHQRERRASPGRGQLQPAGLDTPPHSPRALAPTATYYRHCQ